MGIRSAVAKLLFRINPYWDEIPWNRLRDREMCAQGVKPRRSKKITKFTKRPVHVVIVPQQGPTHESFAPAMWNFYFEAMKLLLDHMDESQVSILEVGASENSNSWIPRLINHVTQSGATHILTHIESDPGGATESWTWDQAFQQLLDSGWDGVLLGVNFDSAFKWIRAKSRRLARMSPQFVAVDICMPLDGLLVKGRPEVGPVNMPVSNQTLELVNSEIARTAKQLDVSFIGALYPYRVELIENLRKRGIDVAVNPHRSDETTDLLSSRKNQPSWLEYMNGLASCHLTINFSQSSAGPYEQLKTRVLEATLAGTFLLTDDQERTRMFFDPDHFATFTSINELPEMIENLLSDKQTLDVRARKAQSRAREIAVTNFWSEIDVVLRARDLPLIF